MPVTAETIKVHSRRKFLIEMDGIERAGFQSCSGLEAELATQEYWEGGAEIPDKQPGRLTVSDVTLERGAISGDRDLYDWFATTIDASANRGQAGPGFKRTFDIVQQDRDGSELRRWTIYGAWPKKFVAGEWDAASDEVTVESVILAIDYFELSMEAGA